MRWKLMAAMVVGAWFGCAVLVVSVRTGAEQQVRSFLFGSPVNGMAEQLEAYYQQFGGWSGAETVLPKPSGGMGHGMMNSGRQRIADSGGMVIVDTRHLQTGEYLSEQELAQAVILRDATGKTIGYWLLESGMGFRYGDEQPLLQKLNQAALQAGLVAIAAALLVSLVLASGLLYPVRQLTQAARQMAGGDYGQRVSVQGRDELAELGRSFNFMAESLQRIDANRRSMTADIAHELRTPLAVQRAQLEAMMDGIDEPNSENLQKVLEQNDLLVRLVDDLRTLSLAEAGELRLEMVDLLVAPFVERVVERFRSVAEQKGVQLELRLEAAEALVRVDPDRLEQILNNLFSNALRYTPVGGKIVVIEDLFDHRVRLQVQDSGPGIPEEALAHVFERFYRADSGRSRGEGGVGLGLAIARQLALVQGGELSAANGLQGGAVFTLLLQRV
jgi:signal transduction histidine kinase